MLKLGLVREIQRLLAEGRLSQRRIAQHLGVGRGTVGAIASGRRGIFGRESDPHSDDDPFDNEPPRRCAGCGFKVYMPCLVCQARCFRARQQLRQAASHGEADQPRVA